MLCVGMCWNDVQCVGLCWNIVLCVGLCWNTYQLYTALLSDSRWIGNPTNHSSPTVTHFTLHRCRIDAWAIRHSWVTFVNALVNSTLGRFYTARNSKICFVRLTYSFEKAGEYVEKKKWKLIPLQKSAFRRCSWNRRIFSITCGSANPTSRGKIRNPIRRDSSEKRVGWFVLSLGQPFLYLFDAKTTTVEQISLFKPICSKYYGLIYLLFIAYHLQSAVNPDISHSVVVNCRE